MEKGYEGGQAWRGCGRAIIERQWEKVYLKAQQRSMEWGPLFRAGSTTAFAEMDPVNLQVRFCVGQERRDQKEVVFHAS